MTALIWFAAAIAAWRYGLRQRDEVFKFLGFSLALVCLMVALAVAPVLLSMAALAVLSIYPTCRPAEQIVKPDCPKFCLLRSQCRSLRG